VLDTGALIAIERGDERMTALLIEARRGGGRFLVPAGVLAQAWREGARQARLALFLNDQRVEIVPLTEPQARAAGVLCGLARRRDVVDASVAITARAHRCSIVSGDPLDLEALDPTVRVVAL
jgi:predicted nucleic acid-binding protein